MRKQYWEKIKDDIRHGRKLSFRYGRPDSPGVFTAEAYHEDMPMPIGVVWFNFCAMDRIQILNSVVFEYVRRSGVRTYIHEQMLASYPGRAIVSGAGTASGAAWMKKTGYRKTKAGWEYRPKA